MDKCETKDDLLRYLDKQITLTGNKRLFVTFKLLTEHNVSVLSRDPYDEMTGFMIAVILLLNFERHPHMTIQAGRASCYYPEKVTRILTDFVSACYGPTEPVDTLHDDLEIGAWVGAL